MIQVKAKVISNEQILGELIRRRDIQRIRPRDILGSWLIWLKCPEIAGEAKPGQFVMVRCGECVLPRPFSIHQVNTKGELAIFYAVWEDGKGTGWLSQRCKGNAVELFGPLGNGFSIQPESRNLLLVAGGIGIAPLYFLAQEALKKNCKVTLVYGTANKSRYKIDLPVKLLDVTEDGSAGNRGLATSLLPQSASQADQIFVCGPMAMYRTMAGMPELKGKSVQVSLEVVMGCGVGVCYGCTVKTKSGLKQACKDGPVFKLDEILWGELGC